MSSRKSALTLVVLLVTAAALPAAAIADSTPPHTLVCMIAPTGSLAGPTTPVTQPPLSLGTIRTTTGAGSPTTTVPGVVLLAPQPQTGAYVVPTLTTIPSLPGVTLTAPQLVVPPRPAPGQNQAVVATGAIRTAVGASAATLICY